MQLPPGHITTPFHLPLHPGKDVPFKGASSEKPPPTLGRTAVETDLKKASLHSYRVALEQRSSRNFSPSERLCWPRDGSTESSHEGTQSPSNA